MSSAACAWKVEGGIIGFAMCDVNLHICLVLLWWGSKAISGYILGGFEVVALPESVSIAHVKVVKVNHVAQDYINMYFII